MTVLHLIEKFGHVIESMEIWVASTDRFRTICRKSLLEQQLKKSNQFESRFPESARPATIHHGW